MVQWFASLDPRVLLDAAFYGRITRSSHAAAYTLMVYDWLLSLEEERKFVIGSKLSFAKVVYLLSRYYPLATYPISMWVQIQDHNRTLCEKIYNLPMFLVIPNQVFAEFILILRTYAFTGGNRPLFVILCASLAAVAIYQAWVGATQSALIPFGNGCFPVDKGAARHLSGFFLSTLLFDSLITLVFVIYAIRVISFKSGVTNPITKLFIREGFAYFLCISAVNIANGVLNFQPNGAMATVNVPMSLVLPSVLVGVPTCA
ncbi:hypothetical protein AURDEDRAFT_161594 [Auricularia subglabra TFB-10046 SS5]|nr:hypothetical protein AURDEDRAFT_161594 [Auricularia subglabra TFB-10046 SS5]